MNKTTLGVKLFIAAIFILLFALVSILVSDLIAIQAFAASDPVNLVPSSIDTDGSIYQGTGYLEGYRLRAVGSIAAHSNSIVSGFIPYSFGDQIIVSGFSSTSTTYLNFYDSSFNLVFSSIFNDFLNNECGYFTALGNGIYSFTVSDISSFASLAFPNVDVSKIFYLRTSVCDCLPSDFAVYVPEAEVVPTYTYTATLDGETVVIYSTTAGTVDLHLEIYDASSYFYFESDYDNGHDQGYDNTDLQRFAGLSPYDSLEQVDYPWSADGADFTISLSSDSPTCNLYSVYEYSLTIDPAGGTWNGSSSPTVVWGIPTSEYEDIVDPVRSGYVFNGWSLSGFGELDSLYPYTYTFEDDAGTLTATWVAEEVPTYTHTISIVGNTYSFSAENAAPPVTIQVLSNGISMSYGNTHKSWTYSGSDTFVGIKDSSGNTYDVGAYFSLLGSSGANKTTTLTPLTESACEDIYSTLIKIYDNSGSTLLYTYLDVATGSCPFITLTPSATGCTFTGTKTGSWTYSGSGSIAGLSDTAGSSEILVAADKSLHVGGYEGQSFVISLYVVLGESSGDVETYKTTVYIDGLPFSFSAADASPDVTITVSGVGCILTDGSSTLYFTYEGTGTFVGLSFSPGVEPNLPLGTEIVCDGKSGSNTSLYLYSCSELESDDSASILDILKKLYNRFIDWIDGSFVFPRLNTFVSVVDFGSVGSFFVDMYDRVSSLFGLKTLIEDPAGPFAWLLDT